MKIVDSTRQNNPNFGASEQETARLVKKWATKKRPDKLVLMLTRDDFPNAITRDWLDIKASVSDKSSTKTRFFREYSKIIATHPNGIGARALLTKAKVIRQELFDEAVNAIKQLMQKGVASTNHQQSAIANYQRHSGELEYNVSRKIPELENLFSSQLSK